MCYVAWHPLYSPGVRTVCRRFLVDVKWMKKWKKYVGYEQTDRGGVGRRSPHPGPVDNVNLLSGNRQCISTSSTH